MSTFPSLSKLPDQTTWQEQMEDPAIRTKTEGGIQVSRARFTRRPRRHWKFGYADLTQADKKAIEDLLDEVKVGSASFDWQHPFDGTSYAVTFQSAPTFSYANAVVLADGSRDHRWNVSGFDLMEV